MTQMVPQGCQNDARAAKLKPQGCPKGAQMAARGTKMAPRGTKKTHKCKIRCKSVGAGATMKPPGPSQCPNDTTPFKTQTKRLPRPGARRRRRRSAAPRQEVAGRAGYVIRFLSKLGGEASPSLRWLRPCFRPLPATHLDPHFSTLRRHFSH